ncbi:MAG TPA: hypothetical protein VF121_03325 [Thermoanaerobaculia bacterium]|nr:hypothetical protein [Thermoanaerobaculia bacterium]
MTELRPTRPADLPALAALFAARFGHPLAADEWAWKYRQLPGDGRSWVAVRGGDVVAHAGALRLPARWRGGEAAIWQLVDFVGAAGGHGLRPPLVDLGRALLDDIPGPGDAPWAFGFPSERHFRLGRRVFGYQPLADFEELVGELPEERAPAGALRETADRCDAWAEAAWERCAALGVRRSVPFLLWRYWARPGRYYRFYRLDGGEGEGLAVFAFVGEEAWAAEVWLPPQGTWRPALLAVAADLRSAGLRRWRFWPPVVLRKPLYVRLGLGRAGERRLVGCRGQLGGGDPVAAAQGFTYSMGDYDLV